MINYKLIKKRVQLLIVISMLFTGDIFSQANYKLDTHTELSILGGTTIIGVTSLILNRNVAPLSLQDIENLSRDNITQFDRSASYNWDQNSLDQSDVLLIATLLSPSILLTSKEVRNNYLTIGVLYFETIFATVAINNLVKGLAQRVRPYAYNENTPIEIKTTTESKRSFYSGHATSAFAAALFLGTLFDEYYPNSKYNYLVWGFAISAASTVGYLRYKGGAHFPSDLIIGAVTGSFLGYIIPYIHKSKNDEQSLIPTFDPLTKNVGVIVRF